MDALTILLGALFALICLIYLYFTRNNNYWESRGVICRKPKFFFGNLKDRIFLKVSLHEFVRDFYNEMKGKPYAGMYEGIRPVLVINDPDLIKLILVKHFDHFVDRPIVKFKNDGITEKIMIALEGNEWKKARVACSPGFSSGKLKAMVPLFDTSGQQMVEYLNTITDKTGGIELDIRTLLISYTLSSVASSSFGLDLNAFSDKNSLFVKKASAFQNLPTYKRILTLFIIMSQVPDWISQRIPLSLFNEDTKSFLGKTLVDTITYRMKNNVRRHDLLQLLIDAQTAPVEVIGETHEDISNEKREILDTQIAIAQSVFFFVAGYETTSTQLTMTCYELAKNKDIQEKARQDILEHWSDGNLTYEAAMSMSYLEMVINESLRMYPPVSGLERMVTKPFQLNGLNLDYGTKIVIPTSGLHYDPQYYPEPMNFKPERFTPEEKVKRHQYVYLPFGSGPRNCLGLRFALINSLMCIAYLLKHFEIDICERTPIPFQYNPHTFFLSSKDAVVLKLTKIY